MTALVSGQHLLAVMPAHPHARRSRRRTAWSRAGVSRAAYRARIRHQQLSRRRSGVVIASRGGRAGTMVGKRGASARRASPSAHGRSRQRATGRWRRNWPPASGCTCDGPRAVAGWPVVHRGSRPGAPERWWEMRAPSARRASHPHAGGRGDGRLAPERVAGHHAARSASRAAALRAAPGRRPRRSRWAASGGGTAGGASWRARPPAREAHCAAYGACTPAPFARA